MDCCWRLTATSVTKAFKECCFQVNAFKPICFLTIIFTVLPQLYERCPISVITHMLNLRQVGIFQGIVHKRNNGFEVVDKSVKL